MSQTVPVVAGLGLLIVLLLLLVQRRDWSSRHRARRFVGRPGSSYTCNSDGCGQSRTEKGGEFASEEVCKRACVSFVKKSGQCVQVAGAPWNSFATENSCLEREQV